MTEQLPVRKYITVWIKNRRKPPRNDGSVTISRTLEWVEFGERRFLSLGKNATLANAREAEKHRRTGSLRGKRLQSGWNNEFLLEILNGKRAFFGLEDAYTVVGDAGGEIVTEAL